MGDPALYHAIPSYCSQKVRLALHEKQVPFESRPVDIVGALTNLEPWYLELNPKGVVPTLVHDDRVVTNSLHIVRYVDQAYAGPPLLTHSERALAWMERLDAFPMHELTFGQKVIPGAGALFARKLERIAQHRGDNPALGPLYDAKEERIRWMSQVWQDEVQIAAYTEEAAALVTRLEADLERASFAAGDTYTLADVMWTVFLARLEMIGLDRLFAELPRVTAYYAGLRERPSFAAAVVTRALPPRP